MDINPVTLSPPAEVLDPKNTEMGDSELARRRLLLQVELEQAREHRLTAELALSILEKIERKLDYCACSEAARLYTNSLLSVLQTLPIPAGQPGIDRFINQSPDSTSE